MKNSSKHQQAVTENINDVDQVIHVPSVFDGRMNRIKYFLWTALYTVIAASLAAVIKNESLFIVVAVVFCFFAAQPVIKRFHDIGHSGWWAIFSFIPFVPGIYLLFWPGTKGPNRYGPDPLQQNSLGREIDQAVHKQIKQRDLDEANDELYAVAYAEIKQNQPQPGLYARCLAEVDGDRDRVVAKYIKYRVEWLIQDRRKQPEIISDADEKQAGESDLKIQSNVQQDIHDVAQQKAKLFVFALVFIAFVGLIIIINATSAIGNHG